MAEELELDVSNDPTIEAMGSEECTKYAQRHWQRLCAERDARNLVLGESRGEDDKLHKLFLAHFGGFGGCDLRHTSHAALHSGGRGGVLERWRAVLTAMEGRAFAGQPMNMMTLLRADALASYDPAETDLILVPRAQFLMIEIARNRAGVYDGLRDARLRVDVLAAAAGLAAAAEQRDVARVRAGLRELAAHRAVPRALLRESGAARLVGRLSRAAENSPLWLEHCPQASREEIGAVAAALRQQWKAGLTVLEVGAAKRAVAREWVESSLALPPPLRSGCCGGAMVRPQPLDAVCEQGRAALEAQDPAAALRALGAVASAVPSLPLDGHAAASALLREMAGLDGIFGGVAKAAAAVQRQWRAADGLQALAPTERSAAEGWAEASLALQQLLAPRSSGPAAGGPAGGEGGAQGLEIWLIMTVQTRWRRPSWSSGAGWPARAAPAWRSASDSSARRSW